eukprot:4448477-Prymnesium_polylepis.2
MRPPLDCTAASLTRRSLLAVFPALALMPPPRAWGIELPDTEPEPARRLLALCEGRRPSSWTAAEIEQSGIDALVDEVASLQAPWPRAALTGKWKLAYLQPGPNGAGVDRRIPFPEFDFNDSFQRFDIDAGTVVNIAELLGPRLVVNVRGSLQEADPSVASAPKRFRALIDRGEICARDGPCLPLPISGEGIFDGVYLGPRLRIGARRGHRVVRPLELRGRRRDHRARGLLDFYSGCLRLSARLQDKISMGVEPESCRCGSSEIKFTDLVLVRVESGPHGGSGWLGSPSRQSVSCGPWSARTDRFDGQSQSSWESPLPRASKEGLCDRSRSPSQTKVKVRSVRTNPDQRTHAMEPCVPFTPDDASRRHRAANTIRFWAVHRRLGHDMAKLVGSLGLDGDHVTPPSLAFARSHAERDLPRDPRTGELYTLRAPLAAFDDLGVEVATYIRFIVYAGRLFALLTVLNLANTISNAGAGKAEDLLDKLAINQCVAASRSHDLWMMAQPCLHMPRSASPRAHKIRSTPLPAAPTARRPRRRRSSCSRRH